jgi:PEP-CTERM/exosortase A-associated glycosyltransferase
MQWSDSSREASGRVREVRGTVLHILDHSFPIGDGYAFRSGEIIRFERRAGWRTIHITSAKQGPTQGSSETVDGLEFHRTQASTHLLHTLPVFDQWGIVTTLRGRLEDIVRHHQPVLLHVHSPCLNGLAALAVARRFALPIIYEIRSLWEDAAVDSGVCREGDLRYRISRALETYVCRLVDQVVTICEGLRTEMVSRGLDPDRVTVVPNSVDLDRFSREGSRDESEAARLGLTAGKTFGFIGTFFPFEGLDVLVRAVAAIRAGEPRARFVFVGDGPEEAKVRALARDLGVEDAIVFTGRVRHAEVERYYDLVDVLVYPRVSKRITELVTPLKPLEAMAKGKLVVASDVGGHREMVFPGKNGMLFKAGDPASLAKTCLDLLTRPNDWNALREHGRRYVRESRSWDLNVQIYDRLYRKLLVDRVTM